MTKRDAGTLVSTDWINAVPCDVFLQHIVGHWQPTCTNKTVLATLALRAVCRNWLRCITEGWLTRCQTLCLPSVHIPSYATMIYQARHYLRDLTLDVAYYNKSSKKGQVGALLQQMTALTRLDLRNSGADVWDEHIRHLSGLQVLKLHYCPQITDDALSHQTALTRLSLGDTRYCTDTGLASSFSSLTALTLHSGTGVRGDVLCRMPALRALKWEQDHASDYKQINRLLPQLTSLRRLVFISTRTPLINLNSILCRLTQLEELDLRQCRNSDTGCPFCKCWTDGLCCIMLRLPRLRRLALHHTEILSYHSLLPQMIQLRHLTLVGLPNRHTPDVCRMTWLQTLVIDTEYYYTNKTKGFNRAVCNLVSHAPELRELVIICPLGDICTEDVEKALARRTVPLSKCCIPNWNCTDEHCRHCGHDAYDHIATSGSNSDDDLLVLTDSEQSGSSEEEEEEDLEDYSYSW